MTKEAEILIAIAFLALAPGIIYLSGYLWAKGKLLATRHFYRRWAKTTEKEKE